MKAVPAKKVKIGILGGSIKSAVGRAHVSALKLDGDFVISAACFSRDQDLNKESALEYSLDIKHLYPNLEDMLKSESTNLDLILILTPTNQHYSDILKCFHAGISVICEKSVACSSKQVRELESLRKSRSLFAAAIFNYTGYSMVREIKERIFSNSIGELLSILIEMPQESFRKVNLEGLPMRPQEWRLKDYDLPTVSLDLGVHVVSILQLFKLSKPIRVQSIQRNHGHFEDLVDEVHGLFEWENGVVGNIWYGKASLGCRNGLRIRIFGTQGSLDWTQIRPDEVLHADASGNKNKLDIGSPGLLEANSPRYNRFKAGHPTGFIEALANHYQDIADSFRRYDSALDSQNGFVFTLTEACEGLEILELLHSENLMTNDQ